MMTMRTGSVRKRSTSSSPLKEFAMTSAPAREERAVHLCARWPFAITKETCRRATIRKSAGSRLSLSTITGTTWPNSHTRCRHQSYVISSVGAKSALGRR